MTKFCPCTYLGVEIARDAPTEVDLSERPETPDGIFDSAGPTATHGSTSIYMFRLGSAAISWQSKRQSTVASSTHEAEYAGETLAAKEAM